MNANLLAIINRIVAEQGEGILADAKRLFPFFSDYAKNEHKEERTAFGRCIEIGAYQELKKTRSIDERRRVKAALADQLHSKTGIDRQRCIDALDLLEAVLFKPVQQASAPPPQTNAPVTQISAQTERAKSISVKTIIFGIAGALGGAAGELISEIFSNEGGTTFWGNVGNVALWAAFIGLGVSVGLLAAQSIYLKKTPVLKSIIKTAIIGILLGAVAGGIAQIAFAFTYTISVIAEIISRIICWGIMGWGVGWGVSMFVPNFPKKRAMAAGFLGGLIGGAIFRATFEMSFINSVMGRIVGIMALGFFIGLTISYIEEAFREAWLTVIWGKNETKTVSLGQRPIVFGSSREADIYLANEAPVKAAVQIENAKVVMYDKTTNQRRELQNGSQVNLGRVSFVVNIKKQ
jgi:Ca-activated chloride channel family protein